MEEDLLKSSKLKMPSFLSFVSFHLTIEISMRIPKLLSLAEPDPVDDGRVVESIREHCVLRSEHGLEEAGVGVKTRPV